MISILKNKPIYFHILGIACLTILITTGIWIFLNSAAPAKQEIEQPPIAVGFTNDLPPPGFMPQAQHVPEAVQAELTQPDAKELFTEVKPQTDSLEIARQEQINSFLQKRDSTNRASAGGFVVTYPGAEAVDYSVQNMDQFRNMDKDYSAHKIPTTVTTRPVDLSRTLPMTEIIPVILIDEIKSELAGEVVRALIPQDVYSYHARNILIPAGSVAIGRYKPLQKIGDTRLAISFYRVVTPEGINIKLSGFAADGEGSEGLTGELDNKTKEKFGGAGIVAFLQAMAQLSIDVDSPQQRAAANGIAQPLNEVIAQVISQSINIAPTLRIQKGSTFNIKFASDIWFPEAVGREINTKAL